MTGQEDAIAFEGTLKGQGLEVHCMVQARNVTAAGGGKFADYKIIAVSHLLPRGVYQLAVNGQTYDVRQTDLGWILA